MKLRNGFVSNSSSTSFLIALKKIDECPHCGRSDLNLLQLIENSASDDCDTSVLKSSKEEILSSIENAITEKWNAIGKLELKDPDEKIFDTFTVADDILAIKSRIKYYKSLASKIRKLEEDHPDENLKMALIEISYHNSAINELFNQMIDTGSIIIIGKDLHIE